MHLQEMTDLSAYLMAYRQYGFLQCKDEHPNIKKVIVFYGPKTIL